MHTRGEKLGVAIGDLNERIAEKLEELETDDIDIEQRLERELKRDYHIITADKRLDQVARDFVQHYSTAWETGKSMLVCIDKVTCVRMHRLIEFYWQERIRELKKEVASIGEEQEELFHSRQLDWMRESICQRLAKLPGIDGRAEKLDAVLRDLDELVDGKGDGVVAVKRGRLDGVNDTIVLPFGHLSVTGPAEADVVHDVQQAVLERLN